MITENYEYRFDCPVSADEIKFSFDFTAIDASASQEDPHFPYEGEFFTFNVGEEGKFGEDSIFQNKLSVFACEGGIEFGGYAPDFCRKSNIIKNENAGTVFETGKRYHFEITVTKYRVYILIDGRIRCSYGNSRIAVTGYAFFFRKGSNSKIDRFSYELAEHSEYSLDSTLRDFLDKGIFTGMLSHHVEKDGLYLDRMNIVQCLPCTTRNFVHYDSGIGLDMITDATTFTVEYEAADCAENWSAQFGFMVDGVRILQPIVKNCQNEVYSVTFNCGEGTKRMTVLFPMSMTIALRKITSDATFYKPVAKAGKILFLGDSITEGSGCYDPCAAYPNRVKEAFGLSGVDQAVGGMTFGNFNVDGDYPFSFDYVMIANGTNSYGGGVADKKAVFDLLEKDMTLVINKVKSYFCNAKIIALLPIWRSDAEGKNYTLRDVAEQMKKIYARYPEITVIDCYDFVPKDFSYFTDPAFAIHPLSIGHDLYADNLIKELRGIIAVKEKPHAVSEGQ